MPFVKSKCPTCGKVAESDKEFTVAGKLAYLLKCGHVLVKDTVAGAGAPEDIISLDNKKLYPFQCDGVRFIESSGARALLADEMGCGKTIQFLGFMALHVDLRPFAIICKAKLKAQWQYQSVRWLGEDTIVQRVDSARDYILPRCHGYIFSFDSLRRFNGKLSEKFKELGIKVVCIDEVQHIKNVEASRTQEVRALCKDLEHIIALSGTPIKNNAAEYFPILNILKPELFPRYNRFVWNECESYYDGFKTKIGGLRDPEGFTTKTKNFIIRRTRKEVLPDLPAITRNFHFSDLDQSLEAEYEREFGFLETECNKEVPEFEKQSNVLAQLSKLRHITGRSKIPQTVEFVSDFLEQTDRKIVIFVHHKDVGEAIAQRISETVYESSGCVASPKVLSLVSGLKPEQIETIIQTFWESPEHRVLVASTLAYGEGINLQNCSDFIMHERQWNPANEEQAEARFPRPGQKADKITGNYMVALGTVDEFFSTVVEQKREIVTRTLGGESVQWDQSSLIRELTEQLVARGNRKWRL